MPTPRVGKFLEPIFIDVDFRFDQPSEVVQKIKRSLCQGFSVVLTQVMISDSSGVSKMEVLVNFIAIDGKAYRDDMRKAHGEFFGETTGECVMTLGSKSKASERIMEALLGGCDAYLLSDEGSGEGGIFGTYTLCYPAP